MARKIRGGGTISVMGLTPTTFGASDATVALTNLAGTTSVEAVVPMDGCTLLGVSIVTKVIGATTGTFTVVFDAEGTNITGPVTIDADAALPKTYYVEGINHAKLAQGATLSGTTVKTGTVSTGVSLECQFIFAIAP